MDGRRWTCCEQRCSKLTFSTVSNWVSSSFYLPSNKTVCSSTPIQFNKTVTHTHTFNGPLSGTTRVSRYQKVKTSLDLTEAEDSEWQWHQLGRMQVFTSLQTDIHASTPPLSFYRPDALPVYTFYHTSKILQTSIARVHWVTVRMYCMSRARHVGFF